MCITVTTSTLDADSKLHLNIVHYNEESKLSIRHRPDKAKECVKSKSLAVWPANTSPLESEKSALSSYTVAAHVSSSNHLGVSHTVNVNIEESVEISRIVLKGCHIKLKIVET